MGGPSYGPRLAAISALYLDVEVVRNITIENALTKALPNLERKSLAQLLCSGGDVAAPTLVFAFVEEPFVIQRHGLFFKEVSENTLILATHSQRSTVDPSADGISVQLTEHDLKIVQLGGHVAQREARLKYGPVAGLTGMGHESMIVGAENVEARHLDIERREHLLYSSCSRRRRVESQKARRQSVRKALSLEPQMSRCEAPAEIFPSSFSSSASLFCFSARRAACFLVETMMSKEERRRRRLKVRKRGAADNKQFHCRASRLQPTTVTPRRPQS